MLRIFSGQSIFVHQQLGKLAVQLVMCTCQLSLMICSKAVLIDLLKVIIVTENLYIFSKHDKISILYITHHIFKSTIKICRIY